jgi:hypothetical protein
MVYSVRRIAGLGALLASFFLMGGVAVALSPNFSGEWKLNLSRSNFGSFPAPLGITRTVKHEGAALTMTILQKGPQGEVSSQLAYTTDGKPVTNKMQGGDAKGSAQWIGDKLMIESSREIQGATLTQKDIWTLAPDGKTLTIDSRVTLPNGGFDIKQVFEKQ